MKRFLTLFFPVLMLLFFSCVTPAVEETLPPYSFIKMSENYYYLSADFAYPEFKPAEYNKFNKTIKNFVESNYRFFKTESKKIYDDWQKEMKTAGGKNWFTIQTDIVSQGHNITSVLIINGFYETGSAHGQTLLKSFNYDASRKTFVELKDVLPMSLKEISEECRKQLKRQKDHVDDMIMAGTAPVSDNFENFTVSGNTVIIWFEPYQVAPWAYGIQKAEIKIPD